MPARTPWPRPQLVGSPTHRDLDLGTLQESGARIVGRVAGLRDHRLQLSGGLANLVASADLKLHRLLDRIDEHIDTHGVELPASLRPAKICLDPAPTTIDARQFRTIVWATGSRPRYPSLPAGLLDRRRALRHDRGVSPHRGLFVVGLPFLRHRSSSFLDGFGRDAQEIREEISAHLHRSATRAA